MQFEEKKVILRNKQFEIKLISATEKKMKKVIAQICLFLAIVSLFLTILTFFLQF